MTDLKTGQLFLDATDHSDGAPQPNAKYITHFFNVDKATGTTEPKADVTVTRNDFAFGVPDEIKAGKQTWKIANTGKQWHILLISWRMACTRSWL